MEAMLGISLYSYLYLKLAKMLCLYYYLLCFPSTKLENKGAEQVLLGSWWLGREGGMGGGPNNVYIHVSKCKSYKIKKIDLMLKEFI
jgi:hypothetical protein